MSNNRISLAFTLAGVTALGWAVACSSSNGGGSGSTGSTGSGTGSTGSGTGSTGSGTGSTGSGTGSTGSGTGSTGSGTGSSTGSGTGSSTGSGTGSSGSGSFDAGGSVVIDNQSNTGGQISLQPTAGSGDHPGTWFSYVASGAPVDQVTPAQGTSPFPFTAITPAATPTDGPTIANAACLSSPGFQGYSVGDGFHFQAALPADAGDGGIATPVTFDATAYTGFTFWAISNGTGTLALRVKIPDDQTDGDDYANSKCKADGGNSACYDDFSIDFPTVATTWTQYTVTFAATAQHGFGEPFTGIDQNAIYGVEFEVEGLGAYAADASDAPAFNFCIAQLAFTTN